MTPPRTEAERLRRALSEPSSWVADARQAQAAVMLRAYLLEQIAQAASRYSVPVVLVKGAALAYTVYPEPWQRDMCDIDLLVAASDLDRAVDALEDEGFTRLDPPADRHFSAPALGEVMLIHSVGSAIICPVEVHDRLDKVVRRPVDYDAIVGRAGPHPAWPQLLIPDASDHLLLVVLHAAGAEWTHPPAWIDLDRLLRGDLDLEAIERRARAWRLETPLWLALHTLRALGSKAVPEGLIERLRPSRLRELAVRAWYHVGSYPVARRPLEPGLTWALRQTPLRDDSLGWLAGVAGYAAVRGMERARNRWGGASRNAKTRP